MPQWMPQFVTPQFITSMVVILVMVHVFLGASMYLVLVERKICAWVQDRCGPNRVGPLGLLQPIADSLKLIVKEEFMPRGVDKVLFIAAPALTVMPALISFAVIPWAGTLDLASLPFLGATGAVKIMGANLNIGLVYLIAVTSLGVYGVSLGGWASNNKYSFLGGLRASCQMISYEIPMGLCLLCVILASGTVRPDAIVGAQVEGQWFLIHHPLVAILFYACMLAEGNRAPFDLAEAEQELIGGWHTEYSSLKWALFFMGEYVHMVVGAAFFTVLFLGGWSINPFFGGGYDLPLGGGIGMILLQFAVVGAKVVAIVFMTMMIRWTLPRFRFDQLMRLAWEGMIPTSLLLLLMTSLFIYMGWSNLLWLGSLGCLLIIYMVNPILPRQANVNHRVPMIGSRFSPLREGQAGLANGSSELK